jgi:predicted nucleic acid-binding protein
MTRFLRPSLRGVEGLVRVVLVDSGGFLASYNRNDADHASAVRVLRDLRRDGASVFTTNFVRSEAYTLIGVRVSWSRARAWLRSFDVPLEWVLPQDEKRAIEILLRYRDKTFSFVDATSFAVMERLGVEEALTFDEHFRQYGFRAVGL